MLLLSDGFEKKQPVGISHQRVSTPFVRPAQCSKSRAMALVALPGVRGITRHISIMECICLLGIEAVLLVQFLVRIPPPLFDEELDYGHTSLIRAA